MRQEYSLSKSLFNIYTEFIMKQALECFDKVQGDGISISGHILTDLRPTTDTMLFSTGTNAMQQVLEIVKRVMEQHGFPSECGKN